MDVVAVVVVLMVAVVVVPVVIVWEIVGTVLVVVHWFDCIRQGIMVKSSVSAMPAMSSYES